MAASYDMIIVRSEDQRNVIAAVRGFLVSRGFRVVKQKSQKLRHKPLSFSTNSVAFVGPRRKSGWIALTSWASELGIDRNTWYMENPLASDVSRVVHPAVFLWTYNAGTVAGYSIWKNGGAVEFQLIGDVDVFMGAAKEFQTSVELAACIAEPDFDYREHMRTFAGDNELGTGILAAKFDSGAHLLDIMDLVDGEGAIKIVNGEYKAVDLVGWTAIVFDRRPGGAA